MKTVPPDLLGQVEHVPFNVAMVNNQPAIEHPAKTVAPDLLGQVEHVIYAVAEDGHPARAPHHAMTARCPLSAASALLFREEAGRRLTGMTRRRRAGRMARGHQMSPVN